MRKLIYLMLLCLPIFAQNKRVQVQNAATVVDFIQQQSSKRKTFSGSFVYKKNNRSSQGSIMFSAPEKLVMDFNNESKIISDGKFVWIINGSIIGRQSLENASKNSLALWNLRRLSAQYTATAPPEGLDVMYGQTPAYRIVFEPKATTTSFRRIELIAERESGLIRKISGTSRVGTKSELGINYKEFNQPYSETNFIVETTEDSQIYDNIFD